MMCRPFYSSHVLHFIANHVNRTARSSSQFVIGETWSRTVFNQKYKRRISIRKGIPLMTYQSTCRWWYGLIPPSFFRRRFLSFRWKKIDRTHHRKENRSCLTVLQFKKPKTPTISVQFRKYTDGEPGSLRVFASILSSIGGRIPEPRSLPGWIISNC